MYKILMCGGRDFTDKKRIEIALMRFKDFSLEKILVISGGANGADSLSVEIAKKYEFDIKEVLPDWDKHGKSAGYIRNVEMIAMNPDLVIAFWDGTSKGTQHTIDLAKKKKIETHIIYY